MTDANQLPFEGLGRRLGSKAWGEGLGLLGRLPFEVLANGVFATLDDTEVAVFARTSGGCLNLAKRARRRLRLRYMNKENFVHSVERLRWAKESLGLEWDEHLTSLAAGSGNLEVLQWAWENSCPICAGATSNAAGHGRL